MKTSLAFFALIGIVVQGIASVTAQGAEQEGWICTAPHHPGAPPAPWLGGSSGAQSGIQDFGGAQTSKLWKRPPDRSPTKIYVGFLDGTPAQKALVMAAAHEWTGPGKANVEFIQVDDSVAKTAWVRISFASKHNDSALGTAAVEYNYSYQDPENNKASMRLSRLEFADQNLIGGATKIRALAVARHEFGHVLGLMHEHLHPKFQIEWLMDGLYDYHKNLNWGGCGKNDEKACKDSLQKFIIDGYAHGGTGLCRLGEPDFDAPDTDPTAYCITEYDEDSVMLYSILGSWHKGGSDIRAKNEISSSDAAIAALLYPHP